MTSPPWKKELATGEVVDGEGVNGVGLLAGVLPEEVVVAVTERVSGVVWAEGTRRLAVDEAARVTGWPVPLDAARLNLLGGAAFFGAWVGLQEHATRAATPTPVTFLTPPMSEGAPGFAIARPPTDGSRVTASDKVKRKRPPEL